jgi:hypothetical protein
MQIVDRLPLCSSALRFPDSSPQWLVERQPRHHCLSSLGKPDGLGIVASLKLRFTLVRNHLCAISLSVADGEDYATDDKQNGCRDKKRESHWLASSPFSPAFGNAPIGNPSQRKVGQLASEVGCEVACARIAVARIWGSATSQDIRETDGNYRLRMREITGRFG